MNYKKIIGSQSMRFRLLKLLSFVPDSVMLKLQYRIKLGRFPDFKTPRRYTEKLQLYKMHYRNPELPVCVDKYGVRDYIRSKDMEDILVKLIGVYDRAEDILFDELPEKFIIKTTDGGGGNNIIICDDKSKLNIEETVRALNSWLNKKEINAGREWAYTGMSKSRIIIEEYLENEENPEGGLEDYKFICFGGKAHYIVHDGERFIGHKRNIYDRQWNNLHIGTDCESFMRDTPRPENLEEMLKTAELLAADFPAVRVDLYNVKNKIYFGELTFYPWSGYVQFDPDEFDYELGRLFDISSFMSQKQS